MKILLLISEMWNDKTHPNNNMSNWFRDFPDVEIATVTGGPGVPDNTCCKAYFQVTDRSMAKSLMGSQKAGTVLRYEAYPTSQENTNTSIEDAVYQHRSNLHFEIFRLARDIIWRFGKYDRAKLKAFIDDFQPDIIFSQRMGSIKMCRMEQVVCSLSNAPLVAYTGDDEYSLKHLRFSPLFWIRRFWLRRWLKKQIPTYRIFYSMSQEQMKVFQKRFRSNTKFLVKCGDFSVDKTHRAVHHPITLVYAGKLYCGRWKTLVAIADAIRKINENGQRCVLHIYTGDQVPHAAAAKLHDGMNSMVKGFIQSEKLPAVFAEADVVLHVESVALRDRLATKYSFSTKIMDCLASGCATMAVCHEKQAGFVYLKDNDIAFTSAPKDVGELLQGMVDSPERILQYSQKAHSFGKEHHQREVVQRQIYEDFSRVIEENRK